MRVARTFFTMCCAIAIATVLLVPGARADEYTKQTYLTFSGPVQIPGVTLPAGTYMFKLANPESGRRAIQVWDEKGTKLFTTLLTIPDEIPEPQDDPVVLFSERPSGSAAAVKSWFYPAERTGYEFIYPKDQAMKIAAASNASVLAYTDDVKTDADETAMRGAQVGRVDAQGQPTSENAAAASSATTTTTTGTTASADQQAGAAPAPSANRTEPPSSPATTAPRASTDTTAAPSTTAAAPSSTTAQSATTAPAATAGASGSASQGSAVGTSGQTAPPAQRSQSAPDADAPRELPRTASTLTTIQLMSFLMIVSGLGMRQLRRRYAESR